ncbi:MAG: glycosyltransferase [Bacteroidota bacterium]
MLLFLWFTAMIIHLGLILRNTLAFFAVKPEDLSLPEKKLSIIVAAKDEAPNLKKLLPSLLNQDYSNFEILIALDRCVDDSLKIVKEFERIHQNLQSVEIQKTPSDWDGKKFALTKVIEKATGEWLVFTDADCLPACKKWLSRIYENLAAGTKIAIGVSPYRIESSLLSRYNQYESFCTAFLYISSTIRKNPYMSVGRNMAVEKDFFWEQGGYEKIKGIQGGDDDLFVQQASSSHNVVSFYGKESVVYTYAQKTWTAYFKQKRRHFSVSSKYRIRDKLYLSLFQIVHSLSILLLAFHLQNVLLLAIFGIYLAIKGMAFRFAARKMGFSFNYFLFPIVDVMYSVLTPCLALASRLEKNRTWKN